MGGCGLFNIRTYLPFSPGHEGREWNFQGLWFRLFQRRRRGYEGSDRDEWQDRPLQAPLRSPPPAEGGKTSSAQCSAYQPHLKSRIPRSHRTLTWRPFFECIYVRTYSRGFIVDLLSPTGPCTVLHTNVPNGNAPGEYIRMW